MERGPLWEHQVFCAVAERQSFVLAARALGASPSAVTRAVQALERQLGAQLLTRSKTSVTLTPQGERYVESARDMLRLEESAREARETQRGAQGRLRFSAPDLLGVALLPAVLRRYAEDYPDVRIDISYTDKWVDPIAEGLDFAVRGGFPPPASCWARACGPERLLCASPDYVARMGLPREPEDLVRHRLIMHTGPRVLKDWHLRGEGRIQRLHAEPAPARQHRQQPDGAGAGRHGRGAAGGLGRAAGNRARHAGARVSGLYRDLGPGRVAQVHAVYASRSLPARARAMLAALRQAGAGLMDAPARPQRRPLATLPEQQVIQRRQRQQEGHAEHQRHLEHRREVGGEQDRQHGQRPSSVSAGKPGMRNDSRARRRAPSDGGRNSA